MKMGRAPHTCARPSTVLTAASSASTEGTMTHGRSWNRSASAASMPACSLPAMGWSPTKWACAGRISFAQRITRDFVLPTSVTTAPGSSASAISANTARFARIGEAMTTRLAPRTASAAESAATSMAFSRRAFCTVSRVRAKPATSTSGCARLSASAMEPPISPSPMMAMRGMSGLVRCLQDGEPRVGVRRLLLPDDTHDLGVGARPGGQFGADRRVMEQAPEGAPPRCPAFGGDLRPDAGRERPEQDVRHALPQRDAPLPAVVQERGREEGAVVAGVRAHAAEHLDAVLLVARHHRIEQGSQGGVEPGMRLLARSRIDARAERAQELADAVAEAAEHQPAPVKPCTMNRTDGPMTSVNGL